MSYAWRMKNSFNAVDGAFYEAVNLDSGRILIHPYRNASMVFLKASRVARSMQ